MAPALSSTMVKTNLSWSTVVLIDPVNILALIKIYVMILILATSLVEKPYFKFSKHAFVIGRDVKCCFLVELLLLRKGFVAFQSGFSKKLLFPLHI